MKLGTKRIGGGFYNNQSRTLVGYKLIFNHAIPFDKTEGEDINMLLLKAGGLLTMSKTLEFRGVSDRSIMEKMAKRFPANQRPVIVEWWETA